ncbi:MAG TPA: hypothetical protein VEA44_13525 [Caulobacter sp.]|nr:hypothetical protein [Caulobacter sp.]
MKAPAKRTGSKKTLNLANLERLGAERLAALMMEITEGQAAIKRRLRLELAGEAGPEELAGEIDKRLASIAEKRTRITWRRYAEFTRELRQLRAAIAGPMAELNPFVALELLWRLIALADPVMDRIDDSKGEVAAVFTAAVEDLGPLSLAAKANPMGLAERVFEAITADTEGMMAGMVAAVLPALDDPARWWLREKITGAMDRRARVSLPLRRALQQIVDAQGDVEGFIATWSSKERQEPLVGAHIASRLLSAGRTAEAFEALERSRPTGGVRTRSTADWERAWLAALEADGRDAEAQELRWAGFEARLDADLLRAHLKRLGDFDDVEAEDRAMAYARAYPNAAMALRFFVEWPNAAEAARLVLIRTADLKGDAVDILEPAARLLEARHPLAAALVLRAMIEDTARWRRAERYGAAHRWLLEAASLERQIADHQGFGAHEEFLKRIAPYRRF